MSPTALQLAAEVLGERRKIITPQTRDHDVLRRWLQENCRTRRERRVVNYLIQAAADKLPKHQTAGGSLKHVLWSLRDIGRELYPPAAKNLLRYLFDHPEVSLANVLPSLRQIPVAGQFAEALSSGVSTQALAARLEIRRVGRWQIAINRTPLNLLKVAMSRTKADIYLASSEQGGCIKIRRGVGFDLERFLGGLNCGWSQPYPDLAVLKRPAGETEIREVLQKLSHFK